MPSTTHEPDEVPDDPPTEHADRFTFGRPRGRGAALNPPNRFDGLRLHVLGEALDEARRERPEGVQVRTQAIADATASIINHVDSPDLGFRWTINPYRGCEHGCVYCYARPTHELLGFSCGLDFETKILVKHDAPRLLRRELASPAWMGEPIVMSGVTDCYQPLESTLGITRACLEVMVECRQPVSIVTKNRLVTRDLDLLRELARHDAVHVTSSVTTLDADLARSMEPRTSRPVDRLRAIRELRDAGVTVGVLVAPVIAGLNDREIPAILESAARAGATTASWVMLRLPHQVKDVFLDWLRARDADRARHVENLLRQVHAGNLYRSAFGVRGRGSGPIADHIDRTFEVFARRHGLDGGPPALSSSSFRRPESPGQMRLFE